MNAENRPLTTDIETFLTSYQEKELLRFVAVGSVDDGKSTLIGRLLFDTGMVYADQLEAIERASSMAGTAIDLSLLTDGLTAEREQGITIDVAYRYFTTERRKFIIADTPGHVQYTRNMVTGASTADVAIILVDARLGVLPQSRRHAMLASLLGIPHLAVCVNKMDLVGFDRGAFDRIAREMIEITRGLSFRGVHTFPISALEGDNCVHRSARTPWYEGPTVLSFLETVELVDARASALRVPIQSVFRPNLDYRGFAAQIASGVVRKGDSVMVLPSRKTSRIKAIDTFDGELDEAFEPQSVVLRLEDEIDCSRGDMIVHADSAPVPVQTFDATVVWMSEAPLDRSRTYWIKHTTQLVRASIDAVHDEIDMETLEPVVASTLALNSIGRVTLTSHRPLFVDPYAENRKTGCFILIDALTNATVGAGMIRAASAARREASPNVTWHASGLSREARRAAYGHEGAVVWLTGLSGSGKSTIAHRVEEKLVARCVFTCVLDGDNVRHGLASDLGFSDDDRSENLRRVGEVARLLEASCAVVLGAFVSPHRADRDRIRASLPDGRFLEVHVATELSVCEARDPKSLYRKAREGSLRGLTGVDAPYEAPGSAELTLDTTSSDVDACADAVIALLEARGIVGRT